MNPTTSRLGASILRSSRAAASRQLRALRPAQQAFRCPVAAARSSVAGAAQSRGFTQSVARLQEKSGEASEAPKEIKIFSFEDMQKLADSPGDIVLIDVREPNELASTGRIPGAINIPVTTAPEAFFLSEEEFEDKFGFERPRKDAEVVFYCRAGVRSKAAAALAQRAGWEKIGEFPGSWLVWAEKGGKVDRS